MTTLAIAGSAVLVLGFLIWLAFRSERKRGESEVKVKHSDKVLSNVEKANEAERGLSDPDERKRVRGRFKRK